MLWRAAGDFLFSLCMVKVIFTEAEYSLILQASFELITFVIPKYLWSVTWLSQAWLFNYPTSGCIVQYISLLKEFWKGYRNFMEQLSRAYSETSVFFLPFRPSFWVYRTCYNAYHCQNQQRFKGRYAFNCNSFQECCLRTVKQIS